MSVYWNPLTQAWHERRTHRLVATFEAVVAGVVDIWGRRL